jgi:hypothetical protein
MRKLLLLALPALALAGCARTAEFQNPVTGATATCEPSPLAEINPWSGHWLCVEEYVSAGYRRIN